MKRLAFLLLLVFAVSARPINAAPIIDLVGAGTPGTDTRPFTVGFAFDVTTPQSIDALGFWDEGANGLAVSHLVRLWNADGSILIASATVTGASTPVPSALAAGRWLFEGVAPFVLAPGRYVIGADGGFASDAARLSQGITLLPGIVFVEDRQLLGGGFPTNVVGASPGIFGPNLNAAAVPEPTALMLLGFAALGFAARRRSNRR